MAACLGEVRQKVKETVTRLMKDIPKIRIGIIAHGDYCDNNRAITMLDLCDDVDKICSFVDSAPCKLCFYQLDYASLYLFMILSSLATGGGDAPEAYELV